MNPDAPADFLGRQVDMVAAIADADKPLPWVVEDLVLEGSVTLVVGRGGVGKTWMAMDLCRAVSAGTSALGFEAQQGKALYFDWENGSRRMGRRFKAMALAPDAFGVLTMTGTRLLPEDHDGFAARLRATILATGAKLVVLDSLRRMTGGAAEDKSDDMGPILGRLAAVAQATNAGIVVVHHSKKDGGSRGSSAIEDQVDAMFELLRKRPDSPVDVVCHKQRDGERLLTFQFQIAATLGPLGLEPLARPERPQTNEDLEPTMAAVAGFLASDPDSSLAAIKKAVSGRGERVARATEQLIALEHVAVRDLGVGKAKVHRLLSAYPPLPSPAQLPVTDTEREWPCSTHDQAWRQSSFSPLRCGTCDPPQDASLVTDWVERTAGREAA